MPPKLALVVWLCAIIFLLKHTSRRGWSKELWIPLIWIVIVGSKTPAMWIAVTTGGGRAPEGSPLDTAILIALMLFGLRVIFKAHPNWQEIFARNKWLFIYLIYIGISVTWSDKPFGSLKLWVKEVGNFIMVLVVLSRQDRRGATEGILVRASYILISLSVLLVKYFPEIGRGYNRWTYEQVMLGASESKNTLGAAILVLALALLSSAFAREAPEAKDRVGTYGYLAVVAMTIWLLLKSNCATALACTIIGTAILLTMRKHAARDIAQKLGLWLFIVVPLGALVLNFIFSLGQAVVGSLGRDLTLTARTKIWELSLDTNVNPLIGAGYASFWYGERAKSISEQLGFFFNLQEAHNGYLETFLNCGALGLILLLFALVSGTAKILKQLNDDYYARVQLAFVVVALIYNVSESAFSGLNLVWFTLVLMLVDYPSKQVEATEDLFYSSSQLKPAFASSDVAYSKYFGDSQAISIERRAVA